MNVTFEEVPVGKIKPDPNNPRKTFDEGQLAELADSIKLHGVQTPIRLRKNGDGDSYVIVAGERRYHAAKLAKLKTIPAVIAETSAAQVEALVENLHREDLNPIEEGDAYRALSDGGMVDEAIASAVARPVERIRDRIGLSRLPEPGRKAALDGLPLGVLREFVAINEQGGRDLVNALLVCADKTNGWSRGPWQLYFALDREDPSIVEKECEACGGDGEIGEDGEYCKACGGAGAVTTRVEGAGWPEFFAVALWASTPLEDMQIKQLPEDAREKVTALRKQAHEFNDAQRKGGGYYAPPPTIGMDDATLKDAAVAAGVTVSFDSDRLVVTDPLWVAEYLPDLYAKKVEEYVAGGKGSTKKTAGKKSDAELTPAERKEKEARAKARQQEVEQRAAGRAFNTKLATTILTKLGEVPVTTEAMKLLVGTIIEETKSAKAYEPNQLGGEGHALFQKFSRPDWPTNKAGDWKMPRSAADRSAFVMEVYAQTEKELAAAKTPPQVLGVLVRFLAYGLADLRGLPLADLDGLYGYKPGVYGSRYSHERWRKFILARLPKALRDKVPESNGVAGRSQGW